MSVDDKLKAYFGSKFVHCETYQKFLIYVQEWPDGDFSASVIEPSTEYKTDIEACKTFDEAVDKARIEVKRQILDIAMNVSENDSAPELWTAE